MELHPDKTRLKTLLPLHSTMGFIFLARLSVPIASEKSAKSGGRSFSSDMLPMPRWASAPEASGLKSPSLDQPVLSDLKVRPPILASVGGFCQRISNSGH
ncbi:MAG: hypothetical protein DMG29_05070 [Acidobacteria bacterium]|nr:MAG: hypothetical protein DMG29_05070 [Acidobacteriota bacterium]